MNIASVNIASAKYITSNKQNIAILATINSVVMSVPIEPANTDYAEIMRQVAAGTLTIADAD